MARNKLLAIEKTKRCLCFFVAVEDFAKRRIITIAQLKTRIFEYTCSMGSLDKKKICSTFAVVKNYQNPNLPSPNKTYICVELTELNKIRTLIL